MNKNINKGFTLIELLAVIVILAVIALISVPLVMNIINSAKKGSAESSVYGYNKAVENAYMEAELNKKKFAEGIVDINDARLNTIKIKGKKPTTGTITISKGQVVEGMFCIDGYKINYQNQKAEVEENNCDNMKLLYKDNSGANIPITGTKMIPIKYDGSKWVKADIYNEWYDYDKKQWVNAVVLKDDATYNTYNTAASGKEIIEADVHSYLVWIPRYKYAVSTNNTGVASGVGSEREINVTFEKTTDPLANGTGQGTDYYSHPAFCFGTLTTVNNRTTCDGDEVSGLWVGKFEVTSGFTTKPDITSLRSQSVSQFFNGTLALNTVFGATDTHMMKNMEWGAMAYLTQSKYGRCTNFICTEVTINSNSSFLTGGGNYKTNTNQSTTGNIYGIYDISGGAWEYVMGNFNETIKLDGFTILPNAKYYDKYITTTGLKGDATNADGTNGWYSDFSYFVSATSPWFVRNGNYSSGDIAGVFGFSLNVGGANAGFSSRAFAITH